MDLNNVMKLNVDGLSLTLTSSRHYLLLFYLFDVFLQNQS